MASSESYRQAALSWVKRNTTFDIATDPLPDDVELFIEKYESLMSLHPGISSESMSGLSQSFSISEISTLLKHYAKELIGEEYLLPDMKAFPAYDRWTY